VASTVSPRAIEADRTDAGRTRGSVRRVPRGRPGVPRRPRSEALTRCWFDLLQSLTARTSRKVLQIDGRRKGSELHDQARANPRSPCSSRLEAERRAFGPSTKRLPRRSGLGDCGSCPTSSHRPNRLHRAPEDRGGFTQVRSSWLKERPVVRHVCEAATARPTGSATHWRKKAKRRPRPSQRSSMGSRKPSARMATRPSSAAPA
jgi:hypothetical protein